MWLTLLLPDREALFKVGDGTLKVFIEGAHIAQAEEDPRKLQFI